MSFILVKTLVIEVATHLSELLFVASSLQNMDIKGNSISPSHQHLFGLFLQREIIGCGNNRTDVRRLRKCIEHFDIR